MIRRGLVFITVCIIGSAAHAAIPLVINHQGFVRVGAQPFTGSGEFKFLVYDNSGDILWSNDGSKVGQAAGPLGASNNPVASVAVTVTNGTYSASLGDTGLVNMVALSSSVFDGDEVYLRVIFDDGSNGEVAVGDQRLTSTAYAFHSAYADTAAFAESTPGFLDGGVISILVAGDVANDLRISEVWCRDDTNSFTIHVPEYIKGVDATWAAGDNAGGFNTGDSVSATQEFIYIWAIADTSGVNTPDYLFSKDSANPTMPSGYDVKRLLGGRKWDIDHWQLFETLGNGREKWVYNLENANDSLLSGGSASSYTTVDASHVLPLGTSRLVDVNVRMSGTGTGARSIYVRTNGSTQTGSQVHALWFWAQGVVENRANRSWHLLLDNTGKFQYLTAGSPISADVVCRGFLENL